jgi:hypothetical protein
VLYLRLRKKYSHIMPVQSSCCEDDDMVLQFMSPEEEQELISTATSAFSKTAHPMPKASTKHAEKSIEQHMQELQETFEGGMKLAAAPASTLQPKEEGADGMKHAVTPASTLQQNEEDPLRAAYAEMHSPADPGLVERLRLAMEDIPEGTKGLQSCKAYFSQKQYYTMLDVLVAQYVLNDGLLMRQHHDLPSEYHVDLAECEGGASPSGSDDDDEDSQNKDLRL